PLPRSSTSSRWPCSTRSCFPPGRMTEYIARSGYRRLSPPRAVGTADSTTVAEAPHVTICTARYRGGAGVVGGRQFRPPTPSEQRFVQDDASTVARRALGREGLDEPLRHPPARHLDQAQLRDLEHLGARLVASQRFLERPQDLVAVLLDLHVAGVYDDDPADV